MTEKTVSVWLFPVVGLVLYLLFALNLVLSFVELGRWATPVAIGIAFVQAILVAYYSMELFESRFSVRMLAIIAPLFVVLLVSLAAVDMATRAPPDLHVPPTVRMPEPSTQPVPGVAYPAAGGRGGTPAP